MFGLFIRLERKEFFRSASVGMNIALKILKWIGIVYFLLLFLALGFSLYFMLEEDMGLDALQEVNKYLIYYFAFELMMRFFLQKMPTANIKPLLTLNIPRKKIVSYYLGKVTFSAFNIAQLFYLVPFGIILVLERGNTLSGLGWTIAIYALVFCFHFINILFDKNKTVFYSVAGIAVVLGGLQYMGAFDITVYTALVFNAFYEYPVLALIPLTLALVLARTTYLFYLKNMYFDALLERKQEIAEGSDMNWLDRFGASKVFLKNDIRLIVRNKRARTTVFMSLILMLYGFFILSGSYGFGEGYISMLLSGIFVTGGFLLSFGQYVPSWDSAHYPLMMTRNIMYRDYLESKWKIMAFATIISTLLASFYLAFFDWRVYAMIVACGVFNIGVNGYLVLLGGAYLKSPMDLSSNKNVMGDSKSFNLKVMLLSLPKLLLPIAFFYLGDFIYGFEGGLLLLTLSGVVGLVFKNAAFNKIVKIYREEKYDALHAYKQK